MRRNICQKNLAIELKFRGYLHEKNGLQYDFKEARFKVLLIRDFEFEVIWKLIFKFLHQILSFCKNLIIVSF